MHITELVLAGCVYVRVGQGGLAGLKEVVEGNVVALRLSLPSHNNIGAASQRAMRSARGRHTLAKSPNLKSIKVSCALAHN